MEILYLCDDFIIVEKPVGQDSETDIPQEIKNQIGGEVYTLHRLDKNVSGVMVYSRNKNSAAEFSKIISNGEMVKYYVAAVHGTVKESGEMVDYLFKDSRKNKVFVVKSKRAGVKQAKLKYRLIKNGENEQSLVLIRLFTGRSHQIRVQFASRGFPIIGDKKYGSKSNKTAPMLYSCRLVFAYKGRQYEFEKMPDWAEKEISQKDFSLLNE